MMMYAKINPNIGDTMRNVITGTHPFSRRTLNPALAMAAPAKPLMMACEELVGNANHQVRMSHEMAPSRPPKTT